VTSPSVGYRTPKKTRGLHPSGYEEVRVVKLGDVQNLNPKRHAIKISSRLGAKKRIELIDFAQKRNFKILNIGITQKEMDEYEALLESSVEGIEEEEEFLDEEDIEDSYEEEDVEDEE
jgi:hypothetical protein